MQKALKYATLKHKGQKRLTGEPYVVHPISVMEKVKNVGLSKSFQKVALLHDVIEDCIVTKYELEIIFGIEISQMVCHLSKKPRRYFVNNRLRKKEYLENIIIGAEKYPEILIIKICDQLDNLNSLHVFPQDKIERKILEVKNIFLPLYKENSKYLNEKSKIVFDKVYLELVEKINVSLKFYIDDKKSLKAKVKMFLKRILLKGKMIIFDYKPSSNFSLRGEGQ